MFPKEHRSNNSPPTTESKQLACQLHLLYKQLHLVSYFIFLNKQIYKFYYLKFTQLFTRLYILQILYYFNCFISFRLSNLVHCHLML